MANVQKEIDTKDVVFKINGKPVTYSIIYAAEEMFEALQEMYKEFYKEGYSIESSLALAFKALQKAKGEQNG